MKSKNSRSQRKLSVLTQALSKVEFLEGRAYLNGVVFQTPGVSTSASGANIAPTFATLMDFNGDGKADLVVANSNNTVSVLLSNGDGTFQAANTVAVGPSPKPLAVGLIDGGSTNDIVTGNTGNVSVILGNGNGTFGAATNVPALSSNDAIGLGDFNGDGRMDIVVVNKSASAAANDRVGILFQQSDGSFTLQTLSGITHTSLAAVAVADLNNDNSMDIALVDQADNKVTVLLNNGNGTFATPVDYNTGSGPTSIVAFDFNGTGGVDLVTADSTGGAVSFLANNGNGTFPSAPVNSTVQGTPNGGGPLKVRLTNINADNIEDLIVLDSSGSSADATVLLGNAGTGGHGNGTFHTGTLISTGGAFRSSIATGDLNGDGLTDAVVADPTNVTALLNVTSSDTTRPTASVPGSQNTAAAGDTTYQFTVTYTDDHQIDASTIGDGNINVTGPNGFSQEATLVSQNLGNAASVNAIYQITFSSPLSAADNGAYAVNTNADGTNTSAVKDANGNAVVAGQIGTLNLNVTSGQVPGAVQLAALVKKKITLKAGKGKTFSIPKYVFPAVDGDYYLLVTATSLNGATLSVSGVTAKNVPAVVAGAKGKTVKFTVVNAGGATDTKDTITMVLFASPTGGSGASATTIHIAPAFVDLANLWPGVLPAAFPAVGKTTTIPFTLQNNGNVTAKGTVTATLTPLLNGIAGTPITENFKVSIAAGKSKKLVMKFKMPTLPAGTYTVTLNVTPALGFADNNSANDTVTSTNSVTV